MTEKDNIKSFIAMIEYLNYLKMCSIVSIKEAVRIEHRMLKFIEDSGYAVVNLGNNKVNVVKK